MLQGNTPIEKKEAKEYPPIPEDVYQVELLDITETEGKKYQSNEKEAQLKFQFVLLEGKDGELDLRGQRSVWQNFVPIFLYEGKNGKNRLYQIVEAIIGRELTREEEARLDFQFLNKLVGRQCRLTIKHKKDGDKVYNNIDSYLPPKGKLESLTAEEREKALPKDTENFVPINEREAETSEAQAEANDKEQVPPQTPPAVAVQTPLPETNEDVEEIKIEDIPF